MFYGIAYATFGATAITFIALCLRVPSFCAELDLHIEAPEFFNVIIHTQLENASVDSGCH